MWICKTYRKRYSCWYILAGFHRVAFLAEYIFATSWGSFVFIRRRLNFTQKINYGRLTAKISILSHGCARPDVYVTAR